MKKIIIITKITATIILILNQNTYCMKSNYIKKEKLNIKNEKRIRRAYSLDYMISLKESSQKSTSPKNIAKALEQAPKILIIKKLNK